jgi:hypothetical protein
MTIPAKTMLNIQQMEAPISIKNDKARVPPSVKAMMKPIKTTRKKIKRPTACLVFFFARLSKQNTYIKVPI